MKKNILISLITLACSSIMFAGAVQPQISLRYNDLVNQNNALETLDSKLVLGFAMDVGEGIYAGFDSDGADSRIFVSFDYGTIGMGMNDAGDPQFTIGGKYSALSNLDVSLDYVVNNLITKTLDDAGNEVAGEIPNTLRMSLMVTF